MEVDSLGSVGLIERIKMNPRNALLEKFFTLFCGVLDSKVLYRGLIFAKFLDGLLHHFRNFRAAHGSKPLDLRAVGHRHNARHNGNLDSYFSAPVYKIEEIAVVKKELGNDDIR